MHPSHGQLVRTTSGLAIDATFVERLAIGGEHLGTSGQGDEQDLLDILMISMIKMKGSIPGREGRLACHTLGTWGLQEDPKTSAGISMQPIIGKIYIIEKIHG